MKNFKLSFFGLILVLLSVFTLSCSEEPEPVAKEGWQDGQKVVYVRDNNGQEFLMNYLLFSTLMNQGGYNSVTHHYYSHPSDPAYRPVTNKFKASRPINTFRQSYNKITPSKVYKPTEATINKLNTTKSKLYPTTYKVSTYKPSSSYTSRSSSYKSSPSSSYKSSRSTYSPSRSSYSSSRSSSSRSSSRSYSRH